MNQKTLIIGIFFIIFSLSIINSAQAILYNGSGDIESCWKNTTCTRSIINGTDTSQGIISYNETPFNTWLIGQWNFNDANSTYSTDSSGNGNHGVNNGATVEMGYYGPGMSFDGIDDYVQISDATSLNEDIEATNEITITSWIKKVDNSTNPSGYYMLVDKSDNGYNLRTHNEHIFARMYVGSSIYMEGSTVINNNEWYFLVVTWKSGTGKMYINAVEETISAGTLGTAVGAISVSTSVLRIGDNPIGGYPFNGIIDEARIYNRSLSQTEISALYNDLHPLSSNITTTNLNDNQNNASITMSSLPVETSFNILENTSGSWTFICTDCINNTWYSWTAGAGQELRVELNSTSSVTPQLNSFEVVVSDANPPTFMSLAQNNALVGASVQYNGTINDATACNTWWIEHNGTGTMSNHSLNSCSGTSYVFTWNDTNNDTAGYTQYWRVWGNDTGGYLNSSAWQYYTLIITTTTTTTLIPGADINFGGLNIVVLYILLIVILILFLIGIYSNSYIKTLFLGFLILIFSVPIFENTFYTILKTGENMNGTGDCISVVVAGVCDIWSYNSTTLLSYSRGIIETSLNFGFYVAFLGILLITKSILLYKTDLKNKGFLIK